MVGSTAVVLLVVPFISALVVRNETTVTDMGTTTVFNQSQDAVVTSAANYTSDEMVETSCHIISEQLVATATATVSSAFSDLCRTEQMVAQLTKLEVKYLKELELLKNKVDRIIKHFIISETDAARNSTT